MILLTSLLHASLAFHSPWPVVPAAQPLTIAAPMAASSFIGFWMQETGAVIEVARQGTANVYAGRYVAFRKDASTPKAKRLLGSVLLKDFKPNDYKMTGTVTDPDSGKDYKGELLQTGPNELELHVKVMGVVARKVTWKRQASAAQ